MVVVAVLAVPLQAPREGVTDIVPLLAPTVTVTELVP